MAGPPQNHLLAVRNREQVFDMESRAKNVDVSTQLVSILLVRFRGTLAFCRISRDTSVSCQQQKWAECIGCGGPVKLRGCKRSVSNRNFCPQCSAHGHHLSIKLFCKRLNHAGTKPGFRLSKHAIRLTGAIVGDRKLPICS
jgi:hypothetical protein